MIRLANCAWRRKERTAETKAPGGAIPDVLAGTMSGARDAEGAWGGVLGSEILFICGCACAPNQEFIHRLQRGLTL
jgi:hypothetical protein